ncbi:hypothetical protein PEBR_18206 [Penicillium brasilianum]|uniref:Yos1-like protein n=1 Tax=Penicillium brasilianum TaxID=104259 RepID=A0A1S9RP32_PENBI|nr:hypothetical protein PEBR_18206 [Penicillium brasilianum]
MLLFGLGNLVYVVVLIINAIAVLSEDRFLARIGWGRTQAEPGFGATYDSTSVKAKSVNLIASVRTVMRNQAGCKTVEGTPQLTRNCPPQYRSSSSIPLSSSTSSFSVEFLARRASLPYHHTRSQTTPPMADLSSSSGSRAPTPSIISANSGNIDSSLCHKVNAKRSIRAKNK